MASPPPPTTPVPADFTPLTGHCDCKAITYTIKAPALVVHCCHCTWCQRESGSVFALNYQVESYNFTITSPTKPTLIRTPSPSGDGQIFGRCPSCGIALYTHYDVNKMRVFVKVGTMDDASRAKVRPDVHIYTSTKVEWMDLKSEVERGVPCFEEYYKTKDVWRKESLERVEALKAWVEKGGKVGDWVVE
ncbi:hypothetical protein DM02DRAFT_520907 [Periconia macrospinosa]|uniref:CENP-V/GFA domain-containing protein n=1 Tax=Periconia macrospinosa TaxID=97972 RepID=A0A2V1E1Q3_9PLEO|nr:hypothetical protein DM02DRAFT_520907 [Periconia macrospinosa]